MATRNVVRSLIHAGAQVNKARSDGRTALVMAARYNHLETARLLIQFNANKDEPADATPR